MPKPRFQVGVVSFSASARWPGRRRCPGWPAQLRRQGCGLRPGAHLLPHSGPRRADRGQSPRPGTGQALDQTGDRGIGGDRSEQPGLARNMATSARQSPPRATETALSRSVLPGSWTVRGLRHGWSASDNAGTWASIINILAVQRRFLLHWPPAEQPAPRKREVSPGTSWHHAPGLPECGGSGRIPE